MINAMSIDVNMSVLFSTVYLVLSLDLYYTIGSRFIGFSLNSTSATNIPKSFVSYS
jgi:hypothetical protein